MRRSSSQAQLRLLQQPSMLRPTSLSSGVHSGPIVLVCTVALHVVLAMCQLGSDRNTDPDFAYREDSRDVLTVTPDWAALWGNTMVSGGSMVVQANASSSVMVSSGGNATASVLVQGPGGVGSVLKLQSASKHFELVNNGSLDLITIRDEDTFDLLTISSHNKLITMRGDLNVGNLPNTQSLEVFSASSDASILIDAPRQAHPPLMLTCP